MILTLQRTKLAPGYTEGKLFIDGIYYCDTLERPYDAVLSGVSGSKKCIPFTDEGILDEGLGMRVEGPANPGTAKIPQPLTINPQPTTGYPVVTSWSPHFHRLMPKICDVPGRSNILIHPGNNPEDSQGCILVGHKARDGFLTHSRMAFDPLYARIAEAYKRGEEIRLRIV